MSANGATLVNISVMLMVGSGDLIQRHKHAAAHTISCALIVHRGALVRWPEQRPHINISGPIGLLRHG
jgi:hypothetical protein